MGSPIPTPSILPQSPPLLPQPRTILPPQCTTSSSEAPGDVDTPEPTSGTTAAPATVASTTDDMEEEGEEEEEEEKEEEETMDEYVYVGCFHDNKADRVLGDRMSSRDMNSAVSSTERSDFFVLKDAIHV